MKSSNPLFTNSVLCLSLLILSSCTNSSVATSEIKTPAPTLMPSAAPSLTPSSPLTFTSTPISNKAYITISSPLENWIAYIYSPTDRDDPKFTTKIVSANGKSEWVLNYHTTQFGEEAYYFPYYWTKDGQYLYLTIYRAMDGCGLALEFYNGSGLFKLDLRTGELNEMVSEKPLASYAFSFSPQDSRLIYSEAGEKPTMIRVKNILGEEENSIALDEKIDSVGSFAWSPNEDMVLFIALENICEDNENYSIITLDLTTLEMKTIVDVLDRNLTAIEWDTPDILRMSDWQENIWILNLKSSQLALATPTP